MLKRISTKGLRPSYALICGLACVQIMPSCAGSNLKIESNPIGADVRLIKGNGPSEPLGKTPLSFQGNTLPLNQQGGAQIQISKEGYISQYILIPNTRFTSEITVFTNLKEEPPTNAAALNEIAKAVAEIQEMTFRKSYDQAESAANAMATRFPSLNVPYELLGNIYYLKKDLTRALQAYRRSIKLGSTTPGTSRMVEKLSAMLQERTAILPMSAPQGGGH